MNEYLPEWNIYNVFNVPAVMHSFFSKKFDSEKFRHINSLLLNNFSGEKKESMRLDFRTDEFSAIVFKNSILQLAQVFTYTLPEDVLYSLLKICQKLPSGLSTSLRAMMTMLVTKKCGSFTSISLA